MTRARGFTLIEVIVATSLLALGLALAFGTLRGATRATGRADILAQRDERLRAVQGFLRTQLNAALPIPFEFDGETGEATFLRASPKKLEFVATMPGYLSRGGPYLQTLELKPGRDGETLVFQHQLLTTEGPAAPEREPVVLLEGIEDASFDVRAMDAQSRPGRWLSTWQVSAQLPLLVRLRLRFSDPRQHWPDFVASIRLGVAFGGSPSVQLAADQGAAQ